MTDDFELIGIDVFLSASKQRDHRLLVRQVFMTLVDFLQRNGLVTRVLLPEDEEISDSFVIRRSDLTDEGYELYRRAEQGWLGAIDRGRKPSNTSILERALRSIRNS